MSRYPDFRSGTWVCAYLIDGLLIDTGPAYTATELVEFLDEKPPELVINTHFHEDHISANKFLQDAYHMPIFAHREFLDKISKPATLYPYQEEVWGYPVPSIVSPLGNFVETRKYRFDVIHTPGHERDHICLFEKNKGWLFTGDLYVTTNPAVCRPNDDMRQVIDDVRKIRSLSPEILFPAPTHVVKNPMGKLDTLINYLEEVRGKIEALHHSGMGSDDIRKKLFGEESFICEATQHQFSSLNFVKSFLGI